MFSINKCAGKKHSDKVRTDELLLRCNYFRWFVFVYILNTKTIIYAIQKLLLYFVFDLTLSVKTRGRHGFYADHTLVACAYLFK